MDVIKDRLRKARINSHFTQDDVAYLLGCEPRTYKSYERGERNFPIASIPKIAELFNVSADYLFGLSEEMQPQAKTFEKATGISESAITNVSRYKNNPDIMLCINQFISSDEFINAIGNIVISKKTPIDISSEHRKETIVQGSKLFNVAMGKKAPKEIKVSLSGNELKEWQKWNASQCLCNLIDRLVKGDIDNGTRETEL